MYYSNIVTHQGAWMKRLLFASKLLLLLLSLSCSDNQSTDSLESPRPGSKNGASGAETSDRGKDGHMPSPTEADLHADARVPGGSSTPAGAPSDVPIPDGDASTGEDP